MASNDVFRHYYLRPVVQMAVYYFILFSMLSLVLPFVFNSIDEWVWIASGSLSLLLIYLYVDILSRKILIFKKQKGLIVAVVILVFSFMNAMYFLNVIPPIPLAIRDAGAFHDLERVNGDYILVDEKRSLLDRILPGKTIHLYNDRSLFVFSAIFAPPDLGTVIVHEWEHKTEEGWQTRQNASFTIVGGREAGFRGWTTRSFVHEGKWRVTIKTVRGQVLGRVKFSVVHVDKPSELIEIVK